MEAPHVTILFFYRIQLPGICSGLPKNSNLTEGSAFAVSKAEKAVAQKPLTPHSSLVGVSIPGTSVEMLRVCPDRLQAMR
jgi:hypothetical protein